MMALILKIVACGSVQGTDPFTLMTDNSSLQATL